eukprot:264385_1
MSSNGKKKFVLKRKRSHSEDSSDDSNVSKKRKLTIQDPSMISSIVSCLDESELIMMHKLNIPIIIHQEIASYAQGKVKYCSNWQCNQVICVFNEDGTNTRYKRCVSGSQIFCTDCMESAIPALTMTSHTSHTGCGCEESGADKLHCGGEDIKGCYDHCCHRLQFIPDCLNCDFCDEPISTVCCPYSKCGICGSKACSNCDIDCSCISCRQSICSNCKQDTPDTDIVCIKCYDDTVIACAQCDAICPLLFAGNERLHNESSEMEQCKDSECDEFVCFGCNPRAAQTYCCLNDYGDCTGNMAPFCSQHIPQNAECCKHRGRAFRRQQEVSYEKAIQILVHERRCIDVYDFKAGHWRAVQYHHHWKNNNRIMISYINTCGSHSKYSILEFPNVSIWHPLSECSYYMKRTAAARPTRSGSSRMEDTHHLTDFHELPE